MDSVSLDRTVIKPRVRLKLMPLLAGASLTVAGLSLVLLVVVVSQFQQNTQDWRKSASEASGQVRVELRPRSLLPGQPSAKLVVNEVFNLDIFLNTKRMQIDGLQLALELPPQLELVDFEPLSNGPLKFIYQEREVGTGKSITKLILTPQRDGEAYQNQGSTLVAGLRLKATQAGTFQIKPDNSRSLATLFGSATAQDTLVPLTPLTLVIAEAATPPPTATPTMTPSITPTVTPGPGRVGLMVQFPLQGFPKRPGASTKTAIWLVPLDQLDEELLSPADPQRAIATTAHSTPQGALTEEIPLKPELRETTVAIFAKTEVSLRRYLGNFKLTPAQKDETHLTARFSDPTKTLLVGDFIRAPTSEYNQLNLLDLSLILRHYTDLQRPITPELRPFDLDYDQYLTIFDLALARSNWTTLVVKGD